MNDTTSSSSSPDGSPTEETPLRESLDDDSGIAQELGGQKYVLNPSRLDRHNDDAPRALLKWAGIVVLSPILLFSTAFLTTIMYVAPHSLQKKLIAPFLSKICASLDTKLCIERTELLKNIRGTILDLGCGSGQYLQYYSNCTHITALEPNQTLHSKIQSKRLKYLQNDTRFDLYDLTLEEYIQQHPTQSHYFDWVILGNVLCEVDNVQQTLQSIDRALKTGGMIYFSEHVACQQTDWRRRLQFLFNPVWKTLSMGCNINRDSLQLIESMPNWKVISWDYSSSLRVGLGPFVLGLAQKVSE